MGSGVRTSKRKKVIVTLFWDGTLSPSSSSIESVQFVVLAVGSKKGNSRRRTVRKWVAGGWILQHFGIILIYQLRPTVRYMSCSFCRDISIT